MHFDKIKIEDVPKLEEWAKFPLPEPRECPTQRAIIVDGKFVGAAFLKLTTEVSLITDPDLNSHTKAKIVYELYEMFFCELKRLGISDTHVFIDNDENHVNALKKHFGFVDATGKALYWRGD